MNAERHSGWCVSAAVTDAHNATSCGERWRFKSKPQGISRDRSLGSDGAWSAASWMSKTVLGAMESFGVLGVNFNLKSQGVSDGTLC
jgi:hypothetical protein